MSKLAFNKAAIAELNKVELNQINDGTNAHNAFAIL